MTRARLTFQGLPPESTQRLGLVLLGLAETQLPGAAVTSVSFPHLPTLFTGPHDLPALAARLGQLRVRHAGPSLAARCAFGGARTLTAADLALATGLDVLEPDQVFVELGPADALELCLVVESGQGQRPAAGPPQGACLPLAARFTPLVTGSCAVVDGDLVLDWTTDAQANPLETLRAAVALLPAELRALLTGREPRVEPLPPAPPAAPRAELVRCIVDCPLGEAWVLGLGGRAPRVPWLDGRGVARVGASLPPGALLVARRARHGRADDPLLVPAGVPNWQVAAVAERRDPRGRLAALTIELAALHPQLGASGRPADTECTRSPSPGSPSKAED